MKIFETMIEGFGKVLFGSQNAMIKNVCLIALTAIISYSSVQSDILTKQLKGTADVAAGLPNLSGFFLGLFVALIVGCYLWGYSLKFVHNVYHENPEEVLPEFDENPVKIFFKALPLAIVWVIYFILLGIVSGLLSIILIGLIGYIVMLIMAIGLQFVWIEFAKDFDRTGLYNFKLPFKYIKPTIGPLFLLGLLYIIVYIICMIPCVLVGIVMGMFGASETATMYVGGIMGGYIGFVCQLVWHYCTVKLYKEKFENRVE
jgi:MFS family permease